MGRDKKVTVRLHSETLAFAEGMLSTSPGSTLGDVLEMVLALMRAVELGKVALEIPYADLTAGMIFPTILYEDEQ